MTNELLFVVLGLIIGAIVVYALLSQRVLRRAEERARDIARELFETQRDQLEAAIHQTYSARFDEWKATWMSETLPAERADALKRARAVLKGRIGEQIASLLPEFLEICNPADARFIGSPIDYVIFRNMTCEEGEEIPLEVVLLDVKTGRAGLNRVQRRVREAVESGRVGFRMLRLE